MTKHKSLFKVIGTDIAGIILLILVPILGPLPGPGGIPLLITGLGLLSINHEWARKWLHYVKKHSENLRDIIFPKINWIMWSWDITSFMVFGVGLWINLVANWWLLRAISIGVLAGSTTIFMMNRGRIEWLDAKIRKRK